jgi:hypothetical protein
VGRADGRIRQARDSGGAHSARKPTCLFATVHGAGVGRSRCSCCSPGYASLHSLLASAWAKRQTARRWLGQRQRNGLYRAFFVAQATLLFVVGAMVFLRLPADDQEAHSSAQPGAPAVT